MGSSVKERVRIVDVRTLSQEWGVLKATRFAFRRSDGTWQEQSRETYDRGHGATILLHDVARRTVILTRQFRLPAYVTGHDALLVEAPAGLLDNADPETRIRAETEEETGFRIGDVKHLFDVYMSPGSVTERLSFFTAPYSPGDRVSAGGGEAAEGEDIETFEVTIDEAMDMVADGRIMDGKTIILLQHAALTVFKG